MTQPIKEKRKITLSDTELEYTLDRGKRKNSYLCISEGALTVKAPLKFPVTQVERFISEKEQWIKLKLSQTKTRLKKQLSFNNADIIFILGEPFTLEITSATKNSVEINGEKLAVKIKKGEAQPLVEKFLLELSQKEILESARRMISLTGLKPQKITIKKLNKSWGRCSSKGEISLSRSLIHYPQKSIDYVVLHELCHLKHLNHSKQFWGLVRGFMPDFELHRNALK